MEIFSLLLPVFVAMDPLGLIPPYLQITEGLSAAGRRKLLNLSTLTAAVVGFLFIPLGPRFLSALGLLTADLTVAGGLLLLVIALRDVVFDRKMLSPEESQAVVPFGIPLLVGPAVLATLALLADRHGALPAAGSLAVNLTLAWLIFTNADRLVRRLGPTGVKVLSKLAAVLLAAYAVRLIREGLAAWGRP